MDQNRPLSTERLRTVRDQMVERFSLSELRDLCFELGLNWDQLSGDTLDGKAISLLERLNRQARLPALLARLHVLRSDVAWALDDLDESAEPPYKGLAYYDRDDARLFFGRERLIARLLAALRGLRDQSFLAVVGKSGSGKSSLVRAGLIPALRGERPPPEGADLPDGSPRWAYLEMTPTDRPLEQLAVTLTSDLTTAGETRAVLQDLQADPATAALYVRKYLERRRAPRAFLLVDQFEELYTAGKDEAARAAFITALLDAAEAGLTTVVITLRADFLHLFLDNPRLRDALQRHQELIGAMDAAELREAVEQPALATGYELEPGLAEVIVGDAGQDAGALPLLSHALLETWRRREGWRLTHAGYNAAGGVGGAIAKTAERAYADLDPAQQAIARRIFLELTELGEGAEDTRRSVALADLLPGDPAERAAAEAVLDGLYRARLVTADETQAQVTHEALIREWPALREWLADNREALRLERRLRAAAAEWDDGGRDASYLYDGAQLAAACQWAATNPTSVSGTVRAFLNAATAEEEREAAEREAARRQREKLTRRAIVGVSAFAALAMLAAVVAFLQRNTAVAAQATTAYEATRAEFNLNEAIAAKATADFNEQQAEIERDKAVTALNDSTARMLMNLSESAFESNPLLADRFLVEAIMSTGSQRVREDASVALLENLHTGQTTLPITRSVTSFIGVLTETLYVVNYPIGNDELISGFTGAHITSLSGDVESVYSLTGSPYFILNYSDWRDELRRIDGTLITSFGENITAVTSVPKSPLYAVEYFGERVEMRRTDETEAIIEVSEVEPWPDSPLYEVSYPSGRPNELRRTDDPDWVIANSWAYPVSGTPFFVVVYDDGRTEVRLVDNDEWVRVFSDTVSNLFPLTGSPYYIVDFTDVPDELRRIDDPEWSIVLRGELRGSDPTPIPNSPFFVIKYVDLPDELRRTDNVNWVYTFPNSVSSVQTLPGSPFFVVHYQSGQGSELRRTDDLEWVEAVNSVTSSYLPFFIIHNSDQPANELRRTDDPAWVRPVSRTLDKLWSIPDSPFFVIDYHSLPAELHRVDDVHWIDLNGEVDRVTSISNSPFFIVEYTDGVRELRRSDSGDLIRDGENRRVAADAAILDANREYYQIRYQDSTSELHSGEIPLVDIGAGAEQSLYFPETNRVAVRYGDGRVVYIDMNLIEALGGADAEAFPGTMSPEELVAFTCETLFTDNPEWDEAKLDEYLAFLPEETPQACQP